MQAVKHREWAATLNLIHVIRRRVDAQRLTDYTVATHLLTGIALDDPPSAVVTTYVCKCLYSMSVGREDGPVILPGPDCTNAIAAAVARFPDDEELSLWACAALYALSKHDGNRVAAVLGVVAKSVARHEGVVIIPYYGAMLFRCVLELKPDAASEVFAFVPVLLSALRRHGSPLLSKAVCWLLRRISVISPWSAKMGELQCVPVLLTTLGSYVDDEEVMLHAITTLRNIVTFPCNCAAAISAGVIRVMMTVLRRVHAPTVLVVACNVLTFLVLDPVGVKHALLPDVRCELKLLGAVSGLVDAAERSAADDTPVAEAVIRALLTISNAPVSMAVDMDDGATFRLVHRVVTTAPIPDLNAYDLLQVLDLKPSYGDALGDVLAAVQKHAQMGLDPKPSCMVGRHVLALAANFLAETSLASIAHIAVACIHANTAPATELLHAAIQTAEHRGCTDVIRRVLSHKKVIGTLAHCLSHVSVTATATAVLDVMTLACATAAGLVNVTGYAKEIVATIATAVASVKDDGTVASACNLLSLLATSDARRASLDAVGVVPVLIAVLEARSYGQVAVLAARAVGSICTTAATRKSAGKYGAVQVLMATASRCAGMDDKMLIQQCMRAVAHIVHSDTQNAKALEKIGGVTAIDALVASHSKCARTLAHACFALGALVACEHLPVSSVMNSATLMSALMSRDGSAARRASSVIDAACKHVSLRHVVAKDWYGPLKAVMGVWEDDATFSYHALCALEALFSTHMGDVDAPSCMVYLVNALRRHVTDVDIVRSAACSLVMLGDVHDACFCGSDAVLRALDAAADMHVDDETLFVCRRRAHGIWAGFAFTADTLARIGIPRVHPVHAFSSSL
jgi:hypothetical protein